MVSLFRGPLCLPPGPSTTQVLQLETRSPGGDHRRIPPEQEEGAGLHLSLVRDDHQDLGPDYWGRWSVPGLSGAAEKFMCKAWADIMIKQYKSTWRRWSCWCLRRDRDPVAADVIHILNFLASLAEEGLAYRSINTFRSAISAGHTVVDGFPVGEHPFVCRRLWGIRLSLPPEPRYSALWDVNQVLNLFFSWQPNRFFSSKELLAKLAMLLCLISCRRVSDVRALDISDRIFNPSGVTFTTRRRTKCGTKSISYPAFPYSTKLCVVSCLKAYEEMSPLG